MRKLFIEQDTAYTYPPPDTDCSNCFPDCSLYNPPPPPPPAHHHISLYLLVFILSTIGLFVFITVRLIRTKIRESEGVNEQESDGSNEVVDDGTVGLQQSVINSIAVVKYKRNEGLVEGTECSVCLNEFGEDETLRLLPKCNHAFHVRCIDSWLKSHTTCPLCRASIVNESVSPQNSVNTTTTTTQIENSGDEGRNGENANRTSVNDDEIILFQKIQARLYRSGVRVVVLQLLEAILYSYEDFISSGSV